MTNLSTAGDTLAETSQTENSDSVTSAGELLTGALKNATQVIFLEGHVPNVMAGMKIRGLNMPRPTREDIENFVRASGSKPVVEKLDLISQKSREDYTRFGQWDIINYSIKTDEFSYRASYRMSQSGAELIIRRIPTHTPLHTSDDSVSPGNQLDAESPTNQLPER